MKTNELKKGDAVRLRNGWWARIEDNKKGNTRLATVWGHYTEMGSIYAHEIIAAYKPTTASGLATLSTDEFHLPGALHHGPLEVGKSYGIIKIEHTPAQLQLKKRVDEGGF